MILVTRLTYRIAYRMATLMWFLLRPKTTGVRCVVRYQDTVLLLRQTYGNRRTWQLPGGRLKSKESARDAAARELSEEVGIGGNLESVGTISALEDFQRCTIYGFYRDIQNTAVAIDRKEVAEVRWFSAYELPSTTRESSRELIALVFDK